MIKKGENHGHNLVTIFQMKIDAADVGFTSEAYPLQCGNTESGVQFYPLAERLGQNGLSMDTLFARSRHSSLWLLADVV